MYNVLMPSGSTSQCQRNEQLNPKKKKKDMFNLWDLGQFSEKKNKTVLQGPPRKLLQYLKHGGHRRNKKNGSETQNSEYLTSDIKKTIGNLQSLFPLRKK
jgi:hypothetical protein